MCQKKAILETNQLKMVTFAYLLRLLKYRSKKTAQLQKPRPMASLSAFGYASFVS